MCKNIQFDGGGGTTTIVIYLISSSTRPLPPDRTGLYTAQALSTGIDGEATDSDVRGARVARADAVAVLRDALGEDLLDDVDVFVCAELVRQLLIRGLAEDAL